MLSTVFVVLAALCWGLSGGIGGLLMTEGWDPFVVSFYRGAIGLLFVLAWLILRPRGNGLANGRLWLWSVIAGLGIAGNFAFYFLSIAEGSVAVAATLMYCAPVFVYLVSFALKIERATPFKWAVIVMVMIGVVLLTDVHKTGAINITLIAIVAGLSAGLCYALFIFGFKNATAYGTPQSILVIAFATMAFLLIWSVDMGQARDVLRTASWPLFLLLGVIGAGLSFVFYIVGLKHTTPTIASIVAMVEPVIASMFGVVMLNQHLSGSQVFGMGLIVITVTMLTVSSSDNLLSRLEMHRKAGKKIHPPHR